MAAVNPSLARTRPARMPATSTRPAQPATNRTTVATAATTTAPPPHTVSVNISIFLTNLRLLDIDLHPEWPDINALTFSTKEAALGQKKRIQCVEWALYQLFALWDPEEARNKLRPFFPPLDQVQSLNLRAALLRSLEQAKKTGALGRDAVVRKTMLDECKGERLEEVLAVFSSAVLKRMAAEQQAAAADHPPLALTLALENRGYSGERTQISVLTIAHKASLSRILRHKDLKRGQFDDLADLLDLKQRSLARIRAKVRETASRSTPGPTDSVVCKAVRNNWSGNERWAEILLSGEDSNKDGLLSTPFDRVWRRVQANRLTELEEQSKGLLERLDARVRIQQERLEKWHQFRQKIQEDPEHEVSKTQAGQRRTGIDLGFGAHENLHIGRTSPRKLLRTGVLSKDYQSLLQGLQEELASADSGLRSPALHRQIRPSQRELSYDDTVSDGGVISELEELDEPGEPDEVLNPTVASRVQKPQPFELKPERSELPKLELAPKETERSVLARPTTPPMLQASMSSPEPESLPVSPTQQMAEQILASMNAASPSPLKKPRHTLSLLERTRLSMTHGSRFREDETDDAEPEVLSVRRVPAVVVESAELNEYDAQEDLLARTRRSMAGFDAAQQRAQMARRRSQRQSKAAKATTKYDRGSYFPAVDEDEGDSTLLLAEELMGGDHDYESVFMSRPKIKTSPVGTPVKEMRE